MEELATSGLASKTGMSWIQQFKRSLPRVAPSLTEVSTPQVARTHTSLIRTDT